ncbi:MAG: restriction endonuclease subunit S [Zhenhengia sp.]|uniref:restriction endonuclease subunit S n=1 Tax=Zhenhengia sp. TaxID=2944208 RepID=UPI003994FD16
MSSSEWIEVELKDISIDGKGSYGIGASAVEYSKELYTYLRITDINDDGTLNREGLKSVDDSEAEKYLLKSNDIVFARTGNSTGKSYFYDGKDGELVYAGFLIKFSLNSEKVNPRYMRYYTLSEEYNHWVNSFSTGSTRGNINAKTYASMKINLPPREQQDFLVNILSSLDEKIELNNQMNKTLEEMAQALFKRWFVDFEFPNEDGEPYKSSGGEMVDSELGMIPKGWKVGYLDDIIEIYDAKRKPLSSRQRANMAKNYPYYGAASLVDYVENYLFDGIYVLISEDGANVVDADGYPLVQYVWDKFWVNNHAHIVKGKNGYSEEHIYILVKNTNMRSIVTGAVQPKINQANLKSVNIVIAQAIIIEKFNDLLTSVFNQYRSNAIENEKLKEMRDILLPKLMSGEIRVTDLQN